MIIRSERPGDEEAISALITGAFFEAEHSSGNEARIVEALRNTNSLTLSLVATEHERIVGHAAFSPVKLNGRTDGWFGLGPVAVMREWRRQGIGSALIESGLATLRERGSRGCVVLGNPAYYRRFGFIGDPAFRLPGVPPEFFQRLLFDGQDCSGIVQYDPAFALG